MSLPPLTVVPAGAGAGKTWRIQQALGEWVESRAIAPERIVAVTFTEAAAAELRERIRARLLERGRVEEALRLDAAYISTIHGFGLRLLTEFAFEAGRSPALRLLDENEQGTLVRLALARTARADALTSDLSAYGYRYDWSSGKGPEESFRDAVLGAVQRLRALGWDPQRPSLAGAAGAWIEARYGETGDGEALGEALRAAVQALLARFPESFAAQFPDNRSAREAFAANHRDLRDALEPGRLARDWDLWARLRALRGSRRGAALPEEYDALAAAVTAAADALPRHPGPRAQAVEHARALIGAAEEVLIDYEAAKREAGLVDYTDMIALARELLAGRPDVLRTLARRVDCLVIDEFQDTNPIQFGLLWELARAGVPALVVGDVKQAIMGFQGADVRLQQALEQRHPEAIDALERNWRSQPALMEFVNAVGEGLFGPNYRRLAPQAPAGALEPLEVVSFPARARRDQDRVRAAATGLRLRALIGSGAEVRDRRGGARPLRGSDVAVLCPRHTVIARYAEVFRALGLRVRVEQQGWSATPEVQIARHALARVANPGDRHAALYLAVTELGSLDLESALAALVRGEAPEEPLLGRLDAVAAGAADHTVEALVAETLAAAGLYDAVSRWPDAAQARANLLRLEAEARAFLAANREALASGGYYGSGLPTFLAWLDARIEEREGDAQPAARVLDEDAVEIVTWHRAKGREWPVVAVCGLDDGVSRGLPDLDIGYADFADLDRLLERARLEYSPAFAARETSDRFLAPLQAAAEEDARRRLYVALTRARERLILECPAYLEGSTRATPTLWSLLREATQMRIGEAEVTLRGTAFPCTVTRGASTLPAELAGAAAPAPAPLPRIGRRAIVPAAPPPRLTPETLLPSQIEAAGAAPGERTVEACGAALDSLPELEATHLGTLVHRCLEAVAAPPARRAAVIASVEPELGAAAAAVGAAVDAFAAWLAQRFGASARIACEVPFLYAHASGAVVSGLIDLLVETPDGAWVIDHKTDRVTDPAAELDRHWPQLQAYADALRRAGRPLRGAGIHWVRRAEVVLVELPR